MNRIVIVFLSFTSVIAGTSDNGLLRFPLITRNRRAADENGVKIEMKNTRDVRYGFSIEIGTPPQRFSVLLDSGSSDLWVSSIKAKNSPDCIELCNVEHHFNESASSTYKKGPGDFYLGYLGGSTKGPIGIDTVSFGGLKVTNQKFGTAVSGITPESFDGIIGVSYAISAQIDKKTVLDRLKEQDQIKNRVFCTKMNVEKKASSEVIFGGCDVEADYWLPNVVKDYWKVNLTKIVLTSKADGSELLTIDTNAIAVFDTGAGNYLDMPTRHAKTIASKLAATYDGNHYLVDCSTRKDLPNMEFHFGDAKIIFTLDDYSWKYFDECQLGFRPSEGTDDFLLGTILFNKATFIFDMDNNRIGLAEIQN